MPLSTRTAVTLGMISLTTIGVATVFGNTILAFVAPGADVSAGGAGPGAAPGVSPPKGQTPAAPSGTTRSASPSPADTARSEPPAPTPSAPSPVGPSPVGPSPVGPSPVGSKDASS